MGGAFTAVADDATAAWWNPAGLAGGSFFNAVLEYGQPKTPPDANVKGFSIAFPALAVSYYRLPISEMRPVASTGAPGAIRQDQDTLSELGVTVGQSLGNHVVVGSTLKATSAGETHAGLDLGAMLTVGMARVGVAVRNVTEATFGPGPDVLALERQARAGFAVTSGRRGVIGTGTVAVDADLTRTLTLLGEERRIAVGAEGWLGKNVVGIRGGVSRNTVGTEKTAISGGLSAVIQRGRTLKSFVDGQLTGGSDEVRRSWGLAFRLTF
jgi:hypothetical protein